jgi:IS5 family transposase
MALPGNPYDGHTLATVIPDMEKTIGNGITRILADAGYRGHNAPLSHKFKVYTSGQKRRMTPAIKREMRRRSAVEPVIGHIKNGHRMDRNYLAGPQGDAINAVLAATGYNFRLLLNWLRLLLCLIVSAILPRSQAAVRLQTAWKRIVHNGLQKSQQSLSRLLSPAAVAPPAQYRTPARPPRQHSGAPATPSTLSVKLPT